VEGPCEHGNEPSGSIKCWKIFEWLRDWRLLKKVSMELVNFSSWTLLHGVNWWVLIFRESLFN
jgi:hypothetical protein